MLAKQHTFQTIKKGIDRIGCAADGMIWGQNRQTIVKVNKLGSRNKRIIHIYIEIVAQ